MVDVIITCQSRRKILYTIGLGFMLILALQGLPGGLKNCIQPYLQVAVILLLNVHIPKTDKYFPARQPLSYQSMKLLMVRACLTKFDNF